MNTGNQNDVFLIHDDKKYTYADLWRQLNSITVCNRYVYIQHNDPYRVFIAIIHSLIYEYPIELLDGDFSESELLRLGLSQEMILTDASPLAKQSNKNLDSWHALAELLNERLVSSTWSISLFTSGSTGIPKRVTHHLKSLARNVKHSVQFQGHIWAFAYNPTHIAGIQVFLQAIWNRNQIVYVFDQPINQVPDQLDSCSVSHISATATYYRTLLPYLKIEIASMQRVTLGGEKFDLKLVKKLESYFPHAQFRNIYASTEAGSLFTSAGDIFQIKKTNQHQVRILEGQLYIHRSVMGTSPVDSEWYATGDLVEQLSEVEFKFVSRDSETINVGGYKVNVLEVESVLLEFPGITDVRVVPKANKVTGYILTAEVVKKADTDDATLKKNIKQYAAEHLQAWKVPRIISIVPEIPQSRSGKKSRINNE
ncbi:AMP-binding protein [Paenibacillus wenxiniae]|uniref:Long-chain-fatty-acid--CoA ligase n=1 Tax=Paenibacillus wenxiniae TaxID=1636843 RepID=A0ABW4RHG4_9BACL